MNYYELLIEGLKQWEREYDSPKIPMLRHFIHLMGEERFNRDFEYYFVGEMEFDDGYFRFHKSMRQVDFYDIGEGHLDMLFWEFNHLSDFTYNVFKTFTEKVKIGVVDVLENDLEQTKGWDKFGLFSVKI
jgi:hypothetical protein